MTGRGGGGCVDYLDAHGDVDMAHKYAGVDKPKGLCAIFGKMVNTNAPSAGRW